MELSCCLLLLLLVSALWPITCGDSAAQEVRGTVGGAVRLKCNINTSLPVKGVYFQKKNLSGVYDILVNGFYIHPIDEYIHPEYKNRTSANRTERSLDFWDLKASDEGYYKCFLMPQDTLRSYDTVFHLTIAADYSVPTVTVRQCSERGEGAQSCELGCSSFGGYPLANLSWTLSEGSNEVLLQEGGSMSLADKHSGVWNVSQTVRLNCTQPTNVSCSVGGAISPPISICTQSSPKHTLKVIIASVVLFLFIFILLSVFISWRPCRRPQRSDEERTAEGQELNPSSLDQAG
ncbi:butyrophilin subfamily 1 member A1-like isoform X2 [Colossoma macropomum]|uniref:butyrophilin subfamily 1 member A1-like isoform X2 n=1 Tax=Colossoma macropomum TaxID=42526 RepID=UPI001863B8C3|nr:butyrophilin subfamily 1 member A1-like isoform X2 [Colossoma macropomum]